GLRSSARVRPSRPSASGGAAPTSTVAPSPSSRWKSRRLRLRSKPAYNIETGLLSIAPSRQAGACHWGGPSSRHSLPLELKYLLETVLVVPLLPGVDKPQLPDDRKRRRVVGRNGGDEVSCALPLCPLELRGDSLRGIPLAPELRQDAVADLERPTEVLGVEAGLAVKSNVSHHGPIFEEDDGAGQPAKNVRILAHLLEAAGQKTRDIVTGRIWRKRGVEQAASIPTRPSTIACIKPRHRSEFSPR